MKPGAYFINVARGEIVDQPALVDGASRRAASPAPASTSSRSSRSPGRSAARARQRHPHPALAAVDPRRRAPHHVADQPRHAARRPGPGPRERGQPRGAWTARAFRPSSPGSPTTAFPRLRRRKSLGRGDCSDGAPSLEEERHQQEDQRGQRAVQAHGDAGEGAGLLADLEGAGGADAVAGDADREAAGGDSRGCRARSSAASRSPSRGCRSAPPARRRAPGCRRSVSVSAMAIGAVTDFAASEARIWRGAPNAQAIADRRADRGERAGEERRAASAGGCAAPRCGCARAAGRARRWRGRAGSARTGRPRNRSGRWCRSRSARTISRPAAIITGFASGWRRRRARDGVADREGDERRGEPEQRGLARDRPRCGRGRRGVMPAAPRPAAPPRGRCRR